MTSANDQTSESPGGVRLCRFAHNAMACTFEAIIPQAERSYAQQAAEAAFAEVDRLEGELSRFAPHSDISRINALKSGQATVVCIEVIDVLQQALALNEDTGGAFDVTYASRHRAEADLCRQPLSIERAARRITAHIDDVRVDLGGLGKGYALDQMATVLRDWDINAALVHSGQSTSRAWGAFGHADGWKVAIRDPDNDDEALGSLILRNRALSGSGRRIHGDHIVDPREGQPATAKVAAWALAPTAALADALSTAFMIMCAEDVEAYCRRQRHQQGAIMHSSGAAQQLLCFGEERAFATAFENAKRR